MCTKNGKIALIFFTQNMLLIQENCAKIACCGKNVRIHKFVKIALHNFAIFLGGLIYAVQVFTI